MCLRSLIHANMKPLLLNIYFALMTFSSLYESDYNMAGGGGASNLMFSQLSVYQLNKRKEYNMSAEAPFGCFSPL